MLTDTPTADESGSLSMDDAMSLLTASEEDLADDDAVDDAALDAEDRDLDEDEQPDDASDQEAADDDAPDEDDPASEDDDGNDEGAGPETATAAPEFWSAEEKALFGKAPPEVQQLVARKVGEAETRVYTAKEEAAAARKEASSIAQVRERIDQHLAQAQEVFKGKWEGVDWARWAAEAPDQAIAARFEFEAEQELLEKTRTALAATEVEEHRQFVRAENTKLVEAVPELADTKVKQALVGYLTEAGLEPEELRWAGAVELGLAYKAMLWDQAKAKLAKKPPTPTPTPAKPKAPGAVRPAAAAAPRKAVAARRRQEVVARAMKSGRMDDGVAAVLALEN